jgi:hypothetical protein
VDIKIEEEFGDIALRVGREERGSGLSWTIPNKLRCFLLNLLIFYYFLDLTKASKEEKLKEKMNICIINYCKILKNIHVSILKVQYATSNQENTGTVQKKKTISCMWMCECMYLCMNECLYVYVFIYHPTAHDQLHVTYCLLYLGILVSVF